MEPPADVVLAREHSAGIETSYGPAADMDSNAASAVAPAVDGAAAGEQCLEVELVGGGAAEEAPAARGEGDAAWKTNVSKSSFVLDFKGLKRCNNH